MTENGTELTELDTHSTVYRVDDFDSVHGQEVPAHAKSRYADEHDEVDYRDCYAKHVKTAEGDHYVIVGEVVE